MVLSGMVCWINQADKMESMFHVPVNPGSLRESWDRQLNEELTKHTTFLVRAFMSLYRRDAAECPRWWSFGQMAKVCGSIDALHTASPDTYKVFRNTLAGRVMGWSERHKIFPALSGLFEFFGIL